MHSKAIISGNAPSGQTNIVGSPGDASTSDFPIAPGIIIVACPLTTNVSQADVAHLLTTNVSQTGTTCIVNSFIAIVSQVRHASTVDSFINAKPGSSPCKPLLGYSFCLHCPCACAACGRDSRDDVGDDNMEV